MHYLCGSVFDYSPGRAVLRVQADGPRLGLVHGEGLGQGQADQQRGQGQADQQRGQEAGQHHPHTRQAAQLTGGPLVYHYS